MAIPNIPTQNPAIGNAQAPFIPAYGFRALAPVAGRVIVYDNVDAMIYIKNMELTGQNIGFPAPTMEELAVTCFLSMLGIQANPGFVILATAAANAAQPTAAEANLIKREFCFFAVVAMIMLGGPVNATNYPKVTSRINAFFAMCNVPADNGLATQFQQEIIQASLTFEKRVELKEWLGVQMLASAPIPGSDGHHFLNYAKVMLKWTGMTTYKMFKDFYDDKQTCLWAIPKVVLEAWNLNEAITRIENAVPPDMVPYLGLTDRASLEPVANSAFPTAYSAAVKRAQVLKQLGENFKFNFGNSAVPESTLDKFAKMESLPTDLSMVHQRMLQQVGVEPGGIVEALKDRRDAVKRAKVLVEAGLNL